VVREILDRAQALPLNVAVAIQANDAPLDRLFAVADATPDGLAALELATRLAEHREVNLHVIRIVGRDEPSDREFSEALAEAARGIGRRLHTETMMDPSAALIGERTAKGVVVIAANVAEQLGVARRGFAGFPDGHPMVLVQGSRFPRVRNTASIQSPRTASS